MATHHLRILHVNYKEWGYAKKLDYGFNILVGY